MNAVTGSKVTKIIMLHIDGKEPQIKYMTETYHSLPWAHFSLEQVLLILRDVLYFSQTASASRRHSRRICFNSARSVFKNKLMCPSFKNDCSLNTPSGRNLICETKANTANPTSVLFSTPGTACAHNKTQEMVIHGVKVVGAKKKYTHTKAWQEEVTSCETGGLNRFCQILVSAILR